MCNTFDDFGFVNPPRHRRLRSVGESIGAKLPAAPEVTKSEDTADDDANIEEIRVNPETTLPEPTEPVVETPLKDPHIKIIVHSTNDCPYCVQMLNTLKSFEDKYEIMEEKHDGRFRPAYSYYYVTSFPYVEYLYDGTVKLYHYGLRTENQIKNYIEQISR